MKMNFEEKIEELWDLEFVGNFLNKYNFNKIKDTIPKLYHPDSKGKSGFCFLHYASAMGIKNVVEYLLSLHANVNIEEEIYGMTPLSHSISNGHYDVAKILLKHGAKLSKKENAQGFYDLLTDNFHEIVSGISISNQEKREFVHFLLLSGYPFENKDRKKLNNLKMKLLFENN